MTFKGINFRSTAVHPSATDSVDDTYWDFTTNESYASAVRGAFSGFGRNASSGVGFNVGANRSGTGVDARLAGLVSNAGGANTTQFKINLPAGPGLYKVRAAFGDRLAARTGMTCRIYDGATSLFFAGAIATSAADVFADINGTNFTAANWPASNTTQTLTFTSSVITFEFGDGIYLTHLAVEAQAAPSDLSGNVTLDNAVAAGAFSSIASSLSGGVTLDDAVAAGVFGVAPGVLTITSIKNNTGTLLAGVTLPNVVVIRRSDRVALLALTAQVINGSGALVIPSTALIPGTACQVVAFENDGSLGGCWPATAV